MTATHTSLQKFIETRKVGFLAIVLFFVTQLLFAHFYCGSATSFLEFNAYAMLPGVLIFTIWQTNWALSTYSVVLWLFCLGAAKSECGPYMSGGASMAYVGVFLVGVPLSLFIASVVGYIAKLNQTAIDKSKW
jgi:hypothetical protein